VVVAGGRQELSEITERRGVVTRASWEETDSFETVLADQGLVRRVGVRVPDSYSAVSVVSRSDMVTLIPRRLALLSAQRGGLKLIEPPYQSPTVNISVICLKERLADPATAWMRELIRSTAVGI
jgi:DNA-binding transcriptional LysR family regulator